MKNNICILGTGAYGIALAKMFHENNCHIKMWTKFLEEANILNDTRMNNKLLPGILIDSDIIITNNLEEAIKDSDIVVIAIPASFVRETLNEVKEYLTSNMIIVIASKGIDQESGLFLSEITEKFVSKENITVISGPSFAIDVVSKQPTGLSIAGISCENMNIVIKALANKYLKMVPGNDIIGVEICGAVKNVMAIASGMLDGFNANPSCNAMFLTEALHDIKDLIKELGGNDRTILSYAGFGDLLLTCTSPKSRNYTFGYKLVTENKQKVKEYRDNTTIEGLYTLDVIKKIIKDKNIDIPIIDVIDDIVNNHGNPKQLLKYLMEK